MTPQEYKLLQEDGNNAWQILKARGHTASTSYGMDDIKLNAVGISSRCVDGKNVIMLDVDTDTWDASSLEWLTQYGNVYVVQTHNGYHIYCLAKLDYEEWKSVYLQAVKHGIEDELHAIISIGRRHAILRLHKDFRLLFVLKGNSRYERSMAHYLLLKRMHNIMMEEANLDSNTLLKFEIYERRKENGKA